MVTIFPSFNDTINWWDISLTFWCTGFEKLLNTWKTTSDCTRTCHTRAVLRIERQLRTWFTKWLSGNHTNWFVSSHEFAGWHINTISLARHAINSSSWKNGLDLHWLNILIGIDLLSNVISDEFIGFNIARHCFSSITASDTSDEINTRGFSLRLIYSKAWIFRNFIGRKHILRHINKTTSEVTRVSGTKSGWHLTLTCTTSGNEGFEGVKTFLVARLYWELDFVVVNIHHDTNFGRCELDVRNITTSTRVHHHGDIRIHLRKFTLEEFRNLLVDITPVSNRKFVTLFISDKTIIILLLNESRLGITFGDKVVNFIVGWIIILSGWNRSNRFVFESEVLKVISGFYHDLSTVFVKDICHHLRKMLLGLNSIIKWIILWQNLVKDHAAKSRITNLTLSKHTNWRLKSDDSLVVSHFCFINRREGFWITLVSTWLVISKVVSAKYHILVNSKHWCAIGWLQEVLLSGHEFASFSLSSVRKW